jgi:hypothetical protein
MKTTKRKRRPTPGPLTGPRVIPFTPERMLQHAARRFVDATATRCSKCDSTFVMREPAFLHCYYCGKMARITNASLLVQEEFEMRSGLRVAS